jgi:hypothetical protein
MFGRALALAAQHPGAVRVVHEDQRVLRQDFQVFGERGGRAVGGEHPVSEQQQLRAGTAALDGEGHGFGVAGFELEHRTI